MRDDKATELYAALAGKLRRRNRHSTDTYIVRDEIAVQDYPELLAVLEEGCQGHPPTESPKCLYCQALADARERLLEAQND